MFVQVGGASQVCVLGAHSRLPVHVEGHVTDFPQLLVFITPHDCPHVVAIGSGTQHAPPDVLQTSVAAEQHVPLHTTELAQPHVLDVHV
jgi:hypothetical protein